MTVIKNGTCICTIEPQGNHGLEGYNIGDCYKFQECQNDKRYFRVYLRADYYETCGSGIFKKHFKRVPGKDTC